MTVTRRVQRKERTSKPSTQLPLGHTNHIWLRQPRLDVCISTSASPTKHGNNNKGLPLDLQRLHPTMSSKPIRPVNVEDKLHFPTFRRLPEENDIDLTYYEERGFGYSPAVHWCLLVEIVEVIPWIRPMFNVKDLEGHKFLVAFHLDNNEEVASMNIRVGRTMSISHAHQHQFADGQVGIRLEDASSVKSFNCDLASFMKIGEDLKKQSSLCPVCNKSAELHCSSCTLRYCSKECQVADWKSKHKKVCGAGQQIMAWGKFNWKRFDFDRVL